MSQTTLRIGERVIWKHIPRGGYGYIFRVPGVVLGFGRGRIKIEVEKANGEKVARYVDEKSLVRVSHEPR